MSEGDKTPHQQLEPYKWKPGVSPNPAGRPKGARNKLGEAFIEALHDDFAAHGVAAIQTVRDEKPDQYLKVIASLLPKDVNLNFNDAEDLTDDAIRDRIRDLTQSLAPFLAGTGETEDATGAAAGPVRPSHIH